MFCSLQRERALHWEGNTDGCETPPVSLSSPLPLASPCTLQSLTTEIPCLEDKTIAVLQQNICSKRALHSRNGMSALRISSLHPHRRFLSQHKFCIVWVRIPWLGLTSHEHSSGGWLGALHWEGNARLGGIPSAFAVSRQAYGRILCRGLKSHKQSKGVGGTELGRKRQGSRNPPKLGSTCTLFLPERSEI